MRPLLYLFAAAWGFALGRWPVDTLLLSAMTCLAGATWLTATGAETRVTMPPDRGEHIDVEG